MREISGYCSGFLCGSAQSFHCACGDGRPPGNGACKEYRKVLGAAAARRGSVAYRAVLAFVIQMDGITEVRPNGQLHPEFESALQEARAAGVEILFLPCHVEPDELTVVKE